MTYQWQVTSSYRQFRIVYWLWLSVWLCDNIVVFLFWLFWLDYPSLKVKPKPPPRSKTNYNYSHLAPINETAILKVPEASARHKSPPPPVPAATIREGIEYSGTFAMPRLTNLPERDILQRLKENCNKEKIKTQYSFLGELGAGAAGTVFRASHKSSGKEVGCRHHNYYRDTTNPHFQFAIKNIDISDHKRKDQLLTEVIVMRDLNHPNLVNYVELFLERDNLMMVMEFMQVKDWE